MKEQSAKKWFFKCLLSLAACLFLIATVVIIIDPYFHYHKPLSFLSYRLYEERYINDGINRHFDYDAIITGTSMSQNFSPGEFDALFGTHSIKQPFPGAGYQEIMENLERALSRNDSIDTVLWTLDYNGLLRAPDWEQYEGYPAYLYDENPFNDVSYLFNKSILYHGMMPVLSMTLSGNGSTTMDEYSSWERECGLDAILGAYDRDSLVPTADDAYTKADEENVKKTIQDNYIRLINQHPNVTFYIFYSPYSICYWDAMMLEKNFEKQLAAEQMATELLLQCPNVKLYNFFDQYEVICNLDNYSDPMHYKSEINSKILNWISEDVGLVTKENYMEMLSKEYAFYSTYNYDSIYK